MHVATIEVLLNFSHVFFARCFFFGESALHKLLKFESFSGQTCVFPEILETKKKIEQKWECQIINGFKIAHLN